VSLVTLRRLVFHFYKCLSELSGGTNALEHRLQFRGRICHAFPKLFIQFIEILQVFDVLCQLLFQFTILVVFLFEFLVGGFKAVA
jgi:hypothetical protein